MGAAVRRAHHQRRGPLHPDHVDPVEHRLGRPRRAGSDRARLCRGRGDLGGGAEARADAADRHQVAGPVRPPRDGRARRRAAQRPAQDHRRRRDHRRDPGPAARAPRRDPLVDAAAGPAPRRQRRHRRPGLAPVPRAAVAAGDIQVQHRPGSGGQGPRRRGAVPQPAREGHRAVHRREEPDPGARPDRADAAAATRAAGARHPRLQAQRHDHAVRGPRDRDRQGDRPVLRAPGRPRRAGSDRARLCRGRGDLGGGAEARADAADRHQVAGPVRPPRDGRARRRAAQRPAQDHRRRRDHRRDPGPAARAPRRDPLVDAAAGPAPRRQRRHRRPGLAPVPRAAVAAGDIQVQHRPGFWRPRSATSWGCTSTRPRRPSCCASTRRARSRRSTGPRRCCRCGKG